MSTSNQGTKEAIQVRYEELENYFANTIIPQLFVDANLILRKFTPPAMTQFNLSHKDIGKDMEEVKDQIKSSTVIKNIREVMASGEILEKEVQTTDGKWYQMNILPYKVQKENRTNGVIITFVDITQRIQDLRELEKLNSEHETLMFALSHDIKQPLAVLSLLGTVLRSAFKKQDALRFEKYLETIQSSAAAVETLINGFVKANDSEARWEKKLERINIGSVVESVSTALRSPHFTSSNFGTDFQVTELVFSRNNLRSIVYNLLSNAINYRKPDRELQVSLSTKKLNGTVLFQVRDNGMGIPEEAQEQIFRKGERLHPQLDGTGMGLFLIKRMLESMGGSITVESRYGEGSTFSVNFPEKPERQ